MFAACFLFLASFTCYACRGSALKCYESACYKLTSGESLQCNSRVITCKQHGMDRCMTIRATIKGSNRNLIQEVRNCSQAVACLLPQLVCKAGNKTGKIIHCQLGCCHGDLCNNGTGLVTKETTRSQGPSGSDLSCYSCSSTTAGSNSTNRCMNPVRQRCGVSRRTGLVQDRCMTVMVKTASVTKELRNCSDAVYCTGTNYCKSANMTFEGALSQCAVSCCYGNLCNTGVISSTNPYSSTIPNELLLTTVSTIINDSKEPRVKSHGNSKQFSLKLALMFLIGSWLSI